MTAGGARATEVDDDVADEQKEEEPADGTSTLREWTTTLIAVTIVIVTLYLLITAFSSGGETLVLDADTVENDALYQAQLDQQQNSRDQRKSILLVAVGILGTVMGYYFGRSPAEKRAERAERTAEKASEESGAAHHNAEQAREQAAEDRQSRRDADQRMRDVKGGIRRAADGLTQVTQQARTTLGSGGQPAPATAELLEAKAQLDALADSLPD
jgi:uncharacterized protein (UPF0333 family)